ncbi:MAG: calcium-binding protein [Pseudomonadota bacterium]
MASITVNATFDGSTDVQNNGFLTSWTPNSRIDYYDAFEGDPANTLVFSGTLTGTDWLVRSMFVGDENRDADFTLTDANAGADRRIQNLIVDGDVTISLQSTRIDRLSIDGFGDHTISLGGGKVESMFIGGNLTTIDTGTNYIGLIDVYQGATDLTIGSGGVGLVNLQNGDDTVTANGFAEAVTTKDGADSISVGNNGDINFLKTSNGNDTIAVVGANARVDALDAGNDDDDITVDAGRITSAVSGEGDDTVTVINGGRITQLVDWSGTTDITLSNDSRINSLQTDGDTNIILNDTSRIFQTKVDRGFLDLTSGSGFIESIVGFEVSSNITIGADGGLGQLTFFSDTAQSHTIVVDSYIGTLNLSDRFDDLTDDQTTNLTVNGSMDFARLGNGDNTVTTGMDFAGSIKTGRGDDTITVGDGGVELLATRDGEDSVTASGYVDAMFTGDDNDDVTIGAEGAGYVHTGSGDDHVVTGTGWVELIATRDGNDTIDIGTGGGGMVRASAGDDLIILSELDPSFGLVVQGGGDNDTMDFSRFQTGVYFTLDGAGVFQNVGSGDITGPGVVGYFSETSVENLTGSSRNDSLTGDSGANVLVGNKGLDTLIGGDGNDTIDGGQNGDSIVGGFGKDVIIGGGGKDKLEGNKGEDTIDGGTANDFLRGGQGADTFVFGDGYGTDKIRDFQQGSDIMQIADHTGGFGTLVITDQGGDRRIDYDGGVILLKTDAGLALTAADFDFV